MVQPNYLLQLLNKNQKKKCLSLFVCSVFYYYIFLDWELFSISSSVLTGENLKSDNREIEDNQTDLSKSMYAFFIFLFSFTHELMTDTHNATMTNKLYFYILFVS